MACYQMHTKKKKNFLLEVEEKKLIKHLVYVNV